MPNSNEKPVVHREANLYKDFGKYFAEVSMWKKGNPTADPDITKQYVFMPLENDVADVVRGEIPEVRGTPVIYLGDSGSKHFYQSHDHSEIPVDVFEELQNSHLVLFTDVDGGWVQWEGRPEFSDTYLDVREAERVDIESIIEERRDE